MAHIIGFNVTQSKSKGGYCEWMRNGWWFQVPNGPNAFLYGHFHILVFFLSHSFIIVSSELYVASSKRKEEFTRFVLFCWTLRFWNRVGGEPSFLLNFAFDLTAGTKKVICTLYVVYYFNKIRIEKMRIKTKITILYFFMTFTWKL
jgi:hypothetical protein